ncbi:hypothetical protein ACFSTH_00860 [Paenibacillus yanchengensis]|uniref:DUF4367 domain-containing protein n=1 Tax=Paenibacillus yanchengensis TaxID=2035833 RepID=A0ABW4YF80_9BACL
MNRDSGLERQLKNIEIHYIDVREQVMEQIAAKHEKRRRIRYSKPQIIIASIAVAGLLTGFAATAVVGIHNEQGKLIFSIRGFNDDNLPPLEQVEVVDQYVNQLQPGEAIAIYSPVNNPENIITVRDKPIIYEQLEMLKANVPQDQFDIPALDANNIQFKRGYVQYELGRPDSSRLIDESIQNDGKTVVEKVPVLDQILGVTMFIEMENQEYIVSILEGSRWQTLYTDLEKVKAHRTIVTEHGDALLIEREDGQQLMWKSDDGQQDLFYEMSVQGKSEAGADRLVALLQFLLK